MPPSNTAITNRRWPCTLILGLGLILACEALLFVDVRNRGGIVVGHDPARPLPAPPEDWLGQTARDVAVNMTVFCWVGYLLTFDGLLTLLARRRGKPALSPIRARPNRFIVAWLTSIPFWCFFDWINFRFLDAWRYHGMPELFSERVAGYFIAFAAIAPGMLLAAELLQRLGLARWNVTPRTPDRPVVRIGRAIQVAVLVLGVLFVVYPFVVREPIGCLTLWVSVMFLLDPVLFWLKQPSLIGDWRAGRFGRTLALMAGGAACGLLWEFWNYWAATKWTYHLPFVGGLEQYRYFEMPWIGFLGFLPFAIECWEMLNIVLWGMGRVGLRVAEPLPDEHGVI